jgi:DeoR family fructose operon transcriptional repressor
MSNYTRDEEYLKLLSIRDYTVKELAQTLFISEPTVRRDIIRLKDKNLVICERGSVRLKTGAAENNLPFLIRNCEHLDEKLSIAAQAIETVKDGDTIMMDGSTTAQCLIPYLLKLKKIIVVTSSPRTALELATSGIQCACTGGVMYPKKLFCYGPYSEEVLKHYYADVAFFSCGALDGNGTVSDTFLYANTQRKVMMENSKKQYLLCDSSKLGKRLNHTLCNAKSLDGVFCDIPLKFDWQK